MPSTENDLIYPIRLLERSGEKNLSSTVSECCELVHSGSLPQSRMRSCHYFNWGYERDFS